MESVPFDEKEPIKVETEPDTAEITLTESGQIEISDTPKSVSSTQKVINALHGVVVPKAQPIKFHHFVGLSIYSAIPVTVYVLFFTSMGWGEDYFHYFTEKFGEYALPIGGGTVILAFILYMIDFTDWNSKTGKRLQKTAWLTLSLGIIVMICLMVDSHPYGPIAAFSFITPVWLIAAKQTCFRNLKTKTFVSWLSGPLYLISIVTGVIWLTWTFLEDENEWNEFNSIVYADAAGCQPDFNIYPECESLENPGQVCFVTTNNRTIEYEQSVNDTSYCPESCSDINDSCINTFILWVGPAMVSMVLIFLSFFTTFLRADNEEKDVLNFGKVWLFLLFTVWVTASLAGIAAGVATALMALTLASFVGSAVFLATSMRVAEGKERVQGLWDRITEKYGNHLDIVRGLMVVLLLPVFFIFLALSVLNQLVRKIGLRCSKQFESEEEKKDFLTLAARKSINTIKSWDRSKVLTYAVFWGAAFMIMQVLVAQMTVLFLSWLIEQTSPLGVGAVTGIMVGVGLLMFLLPPVPGVPIYLTLGIVIIATGRELFGIVGCITYATGVSLALKLLACALQQKMIGENLSNSVAVRQLVGINSSLIKGMRLILSEKGFTVAKVAILVGGPDWPTSVLCGLMRLRLIPILIGTLPVLLLILPTLLTGSFTYMASLIKDGEPEFPFAGVLATVFAAVTAIVQGGAMVIAAYYLEQTTSNRKEELDQIPIDEEVKTKEDKEAIVKECYKEVTQWHLVPLVPKVTLVTSLITMVAACYLVQLFSSSCFESYELTYTITDNLGGDWKNILLPLGRVASLLFLVACLQLWGFTAWAGRKARKLAKQKANSLPSQEEE